MTWGPCSQLHVVGSRSCFVVDGAGRRQRSSNFKSTAASDQQSVFANPDISNYGTLLHAAGMTPAALDDAGKKTAATMGAMVSSFAATGVPTVPGSAWGPAGPDGQFTMTFGYDGSATMGLAKRKYACKVWADTNWQGL